MRRRGLSFAVASARPVLDGEALWSVTCAMSEEALRLLPDNSVDSIVQDPPAGIGFMNKKWDHNKGGRDVWVAWLANIEREALRVLKPGGHAFTWALPRTSHWTALAIENAGFDIRDIHHHLHAKGFPKSLDLGEGRGTGIKPAVEHWILARKPFKGTVERCILDYGTGYLRIDDCRIGTDEKLERVLGSTTTSASGWKSVNRSPVAGKDGGRWPANLTLSHTEWCEVVGATQVKGDARAQSCKYMKQGEACQGHENRVFGKTFHTGVRGGGFAEPLAPNGDPKPNGVLHGDAEVAVWACLPGCPVRELNEQAGVRRSGSLNGKEYESETTQNTYRHGYRRSGKDRPGAGPASRFFFVTKPSRRERDLGCEYLPVKSGGEATDRKDGSDGLRSPRAGAGRTGGVHNGHPTLKGIDLVRWYTRLITPVGGVVLDPFMGSGTTGCAALLEGCRFIGIEMDPTFVEVSQARIAYWSREGA